MANPVVPLWSSVTRPVARLVECVDVNKANANFRDGVLEIAMPGEQAETHGRQLEIHDSGSSEQSKPKARAAGAGR